MHRQSGLLTLTKSFRSFIFITMAVSSPYYLASFHYNSIDIGVVLFLSLLSTSIFVILYGRINRSLKLRSLLLSSLLIIGFLLLIMFDNPIFYVIGVIVGGGGARFRRNNEEIWCFDEFLSRNTKHRLHPKHRKQFFISQENR